MTIPFDCLPPDDLRLAREPATTEEELAKAFSSNFPREYKSPFVYLHYWARKYGLSRAIPPGSEVDRFIRDVSKKTTGYIPGIRLWHLARLLRKSQPVRIVEFGSGVSTAAIAALLRETHLRTGVRGHVVSYEQSPRYYDPLNRAFPDELREYADIRLTPVRLGRFGPFRGLFFDVTHSPEPIDLVYIDGPTRTRGNPDSDFAYPRVNADIVRLHRAGIAVRCAFTDHRWANYPFYASELGDAFSIECSRWYKSVILNRKSSIA